MRPKSPEPPRFATWLLVLFTPILDNKPLAGDLIEAFKQGRSSSWYWRQVLSAILVSLSSLLHRNLASLVYAIVCGMAISRAWFFMFPNAEHASWLPKVFALYAKGYPLPWPWSLLYQTAFLVAFQLAPIIAALVAYLAVSGALRQGRFFRALVLAGAALTISDVIFPFLVIILSPIGRIGWALISMGPAIALLVGIRTAGVGREARFVRV